MATPIKRIEKDFLLKVLFDEQITLMYLRDRVKYKLVLERPAKEQLLLKADQPIDRLKVRNKLELAFDFRGQVVSFTTEVLAFKEEHVIAKIPEFLYKNLDRSYSRVSTLSDLQVQFTFKGDRYSLSYPKINDFEPVEDMSGLIRGVDPKDLSGLTTQMAKWISGYANGYRLMIFKDTKPSTTEECVLAETGRALYLPSTREALPRTDPYPRKRLITEEYFKRYLESTGVNQESVDVAYAHFIKAKFNSGILSDIWVPILFQEYVVGYIHAWINKEGKLPFDFTVLDTLYQFAKIFAYLLKTNGYFDGGKLHYDPIEGNVIDISASGLLFAYPHNALSSGLLIDSELGVRISSPVREINAIAQIVRRYKDRLQGYFGCRFLDMVPEDTRYLFEYIYGKPLTDADMKLLVGQV